jgi:predicted enzyme related to lactoylglutathione lyase
MLSMTTGTRETGDFCWINMLTPQPDEARAFYERLFGWTYDPVPGMGGHIINVGGRNVGGLWDLGSPQTPKGTPPCIGVMVKVVSADDVAKKAESLGGKSKPAFDIAENGRMAECFDPNGAQFDLWQPIKQQGMDADSTLHGAPSWFETMTTDVDRAAAFYKSLFGWTSHSADMGNMVYTSFMLGERPIAGMMAITPEMGPMPPFWSVYFTVDDTDETVRLATSLGAEIHIPPSDIPGVGRFAAMKSPQGVWFYVIRYSARTT